MTGIGVDPSGAEIEYAMKTFGGENSNNHLQFLKCLSTDLAGDYTNYFDVIITESSICHAPAAARKQFPTECFTMLKNGGYLVFNDPVLGERTTLAGMRGRFFLKSGLQRPGSGRTYHSRWDARTTLAGMRWVGPTAHPSESGGCWPNRRLGGFFVFHFFSLQTLCPVQLQCQCTRNIITVCEDDYQHFHNLLLPRREHGDRSVSPAPSRV